MAKYVIDDHYNISGDHYMDHYYNNHLKESDTMISNNDIYQPRLRCEQLHRTCDSDMLIKIQKGFENGSTCVLRTLFNEDIQCREDHDCTKCIQAEINKKL